MDGSSCKTVLCEDAAQKKLLQTQELDTNREERTDSESINSASQSMVVVQRDPSVMAPPKTQSNSRVGIKIPDDYSPISSYDPKARSAQTMENVSASVEANKSIHVGSPAQASSSLER